MIKLNHVSRVYPARTDVAGQIRALDDFALDVAAGEWIAIMGPSGSGQIDFGEFDWLPGSSYSG